MSITLLKSVVPPPQAPVEVGDRAVWDAVQSKLQLQLPTDYLEYGQAYGSGTVCSGFFLFFNWGSPHYHRYVLAEAKAVRDAGASWSQQIAVFPDLPGLVPWGRDENGTSLCWMTSGDPKDWPVVVQSREGKQHHYPMSMTEFLASVFLNQTRCPVWHELFTPQELVFSPSPQ